MGAVRGSHACKRPGVRPFLPCRAQRSARPLPRRSSRHRSHTALCVTGIVTAAASDRLALGLRRRLPALLQTEAAECGLACLAMIASYHGHCVDVATLRRRFTISAKGTTLSSIIDFASRLELSARPIRLEIEDLGRLRLPCILHWNFTHFVVLARVGRTGITIHDPAAGERSMPIEAANGPFTGVALELWPTPRFERSEQ